MADLMYPVVQDILERIQQIDESLNEVSENDFYENSKAVKLGRAYIPFPSIFIN